MRWSIVFESFILTRAILKIWLSWAKNFIKRFLEKKNIFVKSCIDFAHNNKKISLLFLRIDALKRTFRVLSFVTGVDLWCDQQPLCLNNYRFGLPDVRVMSATFGVSSSWSSRILAMPNRFRRYSNLSGSKDFVKKSAIW